MISTSMTPIPWLVYLPIIGNDAVLLYLLLHSEGRLQQHLTERRYGSGPPEQKCQGSNADRSL